MPHNVNRKPVYPDRSKQLKQKPRVDFKKIGKGILRWTPLWIPMAIGMWFLIPDIVDGYRLKHNGIRTTARIQKTYLVTGGRSVSRMVKYYFYVGDSLYYGNTSLSKSEWEQLQPHVQFDIVYEKSNPNNSNWAGYYKDKQ